MITLNERRYFRKRAMQHAETAEDVLHNQDRTDTREQIQASSTLALAHAQISLAFSALAEQGRW